MLECVEPEATSAFLTAHLIQLTEHAVQVIVHSTPLYTSHSHSYIRMCMMHVTIHSQNTAICMLLGGILGNMASYCTSVWSIA